MKRVLKFDSITVGVTRVSVHFNDDSSFEILFVSKFDQLGEETVQVARPVCNRDLFFYLSLSENEQQGIAEHLGCPIKISDTVWIKYLQLIKEVKYLLNVSLL